MGLGPKLRVISRTGVGYDTVDVEATTAAGIAVCHAPLAPTVSTAELKDFAGERLADYKVPRQIHFLPALPRNPGGKVLKSQLAE